MSHFMSIDGQHTNLVIHFLSHPHKMNCYYRLLLFVSISCRNLQFLIFVKRVGIYINIILLTYNISCVYRLNMTYDWACASLPKYIEQVWSYQIGLFCWWVTNLGWLVLVVSQVNVYEWIFCTNHNPQTAVSVTLAMPES